jgi:ABC-type uncharacterized transport system permease subunit
MKRMQRPKNDQLLTWSAFAVPGAVGMVAGQAVAGLPWLESVMLAATIGAVAGGAWCLIVALLRRRHG